MTETVITDATVLIEFNGSDYRIRIFKDNRKEHDFDATRHEEPQIGH
jgi:hypothetical protein